MAHSTNTEPNGNCSGITRCGVTAKSQINAADDRVLAMRRRADLAVRRECYQGRWHWVVKDPLALAYYRLREEEYAILQALDGQSSVAQIRAKVERQFAPQRISAAELQGFVAQLYRNGLVITDSPGQGLLLAARADAARRQRRLASLTNVLAFRCRGFDPEWLLGRLYPIAGWCFTPLAALAFALLAVAAAMLVVVNFGEFQTRLPAWHEVLHPGNWLLLAVVIAVTKMLHELGHGLSCKHFGGECHEIGVMFLVLTPCLYCNVSDAWLLPSKWRRAAIGAAGMYVEVVLASLATFVWWYSQPGMIHDAALMVMSICSLNTVLFNGNPLLRYDGYYILADLVEVPNLRQQAYLLLRREMAKLCLGIDPPEDPFLPSSRGWFLAYAITASVYRWVLLASVLWFLHAAFAQYGLEVIAQLLTAVVLFGMFGPMLWRGVALLRSPARRNTMNRKRVSLTCSVVALLLLFTVFVPLPQWVDCAFEIRPRGATPVYINVAGQVEQVFVAGGETVAAGAPLARLENVDIALSVAHLGAQASSQTIRLASLEYQRYRDPLSGELVAQAQENLEATRQQLDQQQADLARLTIAAPVAGTVFPPPRLYPVTPAGVLPAWAGTPLEARNRGALLTPGVMLCEIGDPQAFEAVLLIDQGDVELVQLEQSVRLSLAALPGEVFDSAIAEIAQQELSSLPTQLSTAGGGTLTTRIDRTGVQHPVSASYSARAPLAPNANLTVGLRGAARIHTGYQTLAGRFWRYLCQTFHFLV